MQKIYIQKWKGRENKVETTGLVNKLHATPRIRELAGKSDANNNGAALYFLLYMHYNNIFILFYMQDYNIIKYC